MHKLSSWIWKKQNPENIKKNLKETVKVKTIEKIISDKAHKEVTEKDFIDKQTDRPKKKRPAKKATKEEVKWWIID